MDRSVLGWNDVDQPSGDMRCNFKYKNRTIDTVGFKLSTIVCLLSIY